MDVVVVVFVLVVDVVVMVVGTVVLLAAKLTKKSFFIPVAQCISIIRIDQEFHNLG